MQSSHAVAARRAVVIGSYAEGEPRFIMRYLDTLIAIAWRQQVHHARASTDRRAVAPSVNTTESRP